MAGKKAVFTALRMALTIATATFGVGCFWAGPSAEDVKVAEAEYGLANDAFARQKYRAALDHVERALERDETNAEAAYLGAMVMLVFCAQDETSTDCRYPRAEAFIRQALAAKPDMRDAQNALGVVLVHLDRPSEAVEVLEPLSRDMLYASPEKAWGNLGWALLEANRVDEAIPALKRAVAAQPLFCVGHYRLGLAYQRTKAFKAARQAFTRAVAIEEGQCGRLQVAFWERARVQKKLGHLDGMRSDLLRCRDLGKVTQVGKKCAARLARNP
ncbi:MAG: tetratricopeptide repeat protein [Myxococcota bacterium]